MKSFCPRAFVKELLFSTAGCIGLMSVITTSRSAGSAMVGKALPTQLRRADNTACTLCTAVYHTCTACVSLSTVPFLPACSLSVRGQQGEKLSGQQNAYAYTSPSSYRIAVVSITLSILDVVFLGLGLPAVMPMWPSVVCCICLTSFCALSACGTTPNTGLWIMPAHAQHST